MNNGKVRIYELSRELNLDNKDLLAVCEQLNISVKSHSSTITDSEAELIRTAAEKYTANHPSPAKSAPSRNGANSQTVEAKTKAAPVQKKQQILEIRKPIIRQAPSPEPPHYPKPGAPQPTAIESPTAPTQLASTKPTAPTRPAHPATATPTDPVVSAEPPIPTAELLPDDHFNEGDRSSELANALEESVVIPDASTTAPVIASSSPDRSSRQNLSQPELSGPPARPAAPSAPTNAQRINLTNKPLLKRGRSEQTSQSSEPVELVGRLDSAERDLASRPPAKPAPVNRAPGPVRPTDPNSAPKPQTIVELRRPPRPVRPGDGVVEGARPTEALCCE